MSLPKLKETAKKLFAKVYNISAHLVTVNVIKKTFPKFRATNKEHWEMLILKLLGRDKKANKPQQKPQQTPYHQIKVRADSLSKLGVNVYEYDFLCGDVSCKVSYQGLICGGLGWAAGKQSWFWRPGIFGARRFVDTLDLAVSKLVRVG
jgi:hypothetical protein